MCGLAGAGDRSLVKAYLCLSFSMLIVFFFFFLPPFLLHRAFHIIISYFLVKDRNSLCLAFRSVNSEISDFFKLSMQGIC